MTSPHDIIREPVVSEKSYALIDAGAYTFNVALEATKPQIKDAIEEIFDVKVKKVNTLRRKGKATMNRRNGTRGKRPDIKRAIVTLVEGDSIDLFES